MASVSLNNISKNYGRLPALVDVHLEIGEGEFIVLLGPSGCGKTTLLRTIAGFVAPSSGSVLIDGEEVTHTPPRARNIGMVFQNYALFPNMTVAENIGFGLRQRRMKKRLITERVREMLELVRLEGVGNRYVDALSGGQQQRVALARALAISPRLLLMDEPLSALDQKLRESMQWELQRLQKELGITTVLVTHDQHEAMNLADRIVVMSEGRIQQIGDAQELYKSPVNRFVAEFVGRTNILRGSVVGNDNGKSLIRFANDKLGALCHSRRYEIGSELDLTIRPEDVHIIASADSSGESISGKVERQIYLGSRAYCLVDIGAGENLLIETSTGEHAPRIGERVALALEPDRFMVFPASE